MTSDAPKFLTFEIIESTENSENFSMLLPLYTNSSEIGGQSGKVYYIMGLVYKSIPIRYRIIQIF